MDKRSVIEIRNEKAFDSFQFQYTFACWIRNTYTDNGMRILDKNTAGIIDGFNFDIMKEPNGDRFTLRLCAGGGCYENHRFLYRGTWYHVAVTFAYESALVFYVDGQPNPTHVPYWLPTKTNALNLIIAGPARGNAPRWQGDIDDVSLWKRALSTSEILRLMFQRIKNNEDGLIAYWDFNEGYGNIVVDKSIEGHNGVIIGKPKWLKDLGKPLNLGCCY